MLTSHTSAAQHQRYIAITRRRDQSQRRVVLRCRACRVPVVVEERESRYQLRGQNSLVSSGPRGLEVSGNCPACNARYRATIQTPIQQAA